MKLDRTFNTKRNILFGLINKCIRTIFPFIIRTVIIYRLGEQYLGLNSLFTSILSTLSLAELGFDTAVVTIMYKAVAYEDHISINALLKFIKRAYIGVGAFILICGILCIPFLSYLIHDYSMLPNEINITHIYIVFLLNTVTTFFFGGYRRCILQAFQRQDVISNIDTYVIVIFSTIEIAALSLTSNYYIYIYIILVSNIALNITTYIQTSRIYPTIKPTGNVDEEQKKQIKKILFGTFLSRVGGVLSISFDSIVISSFLGVTILGYYSNYSYVISAIQGFLIAIYISLQAGIGNSIALDSKEKNYKNMMLFSFMFNWIVGWCSICLMLLFKPFINIWAGQDYVLPLEVQSFIVLNFYIVMCGSIQGVYKNAIGIWWEDRYRCIVSGVVNLIFNLFFVISLQKYGLLYALAGVVISTIISDLFVATPWSIYVTFKVYFKTGVKEYISLLVRFFAYTILNLCICWAFINLIENVINDLIVSFAIRSAVCVVLPNMIYILFYKNNMMFAEAVNFLKRRIICFKG